MWNTIEKIWKNRDLRNKILFVLAMLVIFRFAAHIPIPGVNLDQLRNLFESNQMLGLMNIFSGGSMQNFSIVMMGIAPYITSSIIFQLLGMISPKLEEMQKEEAGKKKINMWTRYATVPLAAMQSYGMITLLQQSAGNILSGVGAVQLFTMILTITAGTTFLMWIGELISEKQIGNGISLLIFAGIISGLPSTVKKLIINYQPSDIYLLIGFAIITVITVVGIVLINEAQRNVPVQYARQVKGNSSYGGTTSNLPLRVNMAGVIPIIFAISVVLFPSMIAKFFVHAQTDWIANFAQFTIDLFNNQLFYGVVYFLLVFAFTYFYTQVVFHPDKIAENLQKQGAFIPGIRPGKNTSQYLADISHKIIFFGALFLGVIAILPLVMKYISGVDALAVGGTSLLIVVSVVVDVVKQVQSQLTMREYEKL